MFLFILSLIFLVGALIGFGVSFGIKNNTPDQYGRGSDIPTKSITRWISVVVAAIAFLLIFMDSFVSVGTKNLGVETVGGKPVGYLTNGYHFVAPWVSVTELTNAVQTDTYASDGSDSSKTQGGATDTCVHVRIARQGTACVNVSIRWQAKGSGIDYLFRNFKNNNAITDNLVLRDLQTAMNQEFVSYDPLGIDANGLNTNKSLSDIATTVQTKMAGEVGTWIDVQSVNIPLLNFDNATQDKINALQQQVAATRVAAQQYLTNLQQAKANTALAQSVSNSPGVLVAKCLDILKEAVDKGQQLPAGFSCFGGSGTQIAVGVK
jgi:regulator of protease activity HflC (stomatin/prohibitin superfamily)